MSPWGNKRNLLLVMTLTVILLSVVAQSVGARALFDNRVWLEGKSDPRLRVYLHEITMQTSRRIDVILVFSKVPSPSDLAELAPLCQLNTFTGHVATVNAPLNSLSSIAALPFVSRIAMPRLLKPELDVSVPEILADQVWNVTKYPGVRDSEGNVVNGTGIIIGVADSGIDYYHKDFDFPNGTSKILYIWDQYTAGTPPEGYHYGNECTSIEIQSRTCTEYDGPPGTTLTAGHGTAVAAVAASSGQASHRYYGVAPGASIIAVKLIDGAENHVIDATNYMITKARQLGRPIVIVHSLGDQLGSHDGTEPLELAFTDFANEGVPIIVSSGDEQTLNIHVSGTLPPGASVTVPWSMSGDYNLIDLWYPTSDQFGISVTTPSGEVVNGETPDSGVSTSEGNVIMLPDMRPSGREWWINVTTTGLPVSSEWLFTLTSISGPAGKWDAWTEPGRFVYRTSSPGTVAYSIDTSDTIDAPGTAVGVITVGGYITKYTWLARCTACIQYNRDNGVYGLWTETPGWLFPASPGLSKSLFHSLPLSLKYDWLGPLGQLFNGTVGGSGIGPTRDGRIKPEIVAPAGMIAAARASTDAEVCQPPPGTCSDPDDYHTMWVGTSFSAPHVAGVVALMLQMNPYLTPDEIKSILEENGRQDSFTGTINKQTGSPIWGWGKVNALSSTRDAPSLYSVRITVPSVGASLFVELKLDGESAGTIPLNATTTLALEFRRGGTHTVQLPQIISLGPGTRYLLTDFSWTFASGGAKTFSYVLQYYLQVNSEYGNATGLGWYNANGTAVIGVNPTMVDNHRFEGWIGSAVISSATATITMDSSKSLSATWSPGLPTQRQVENSPATLAAAVLLGVIVVLVVFLRLHPVQRRSRQRPSADLQQHPS